MYVAYTVKTSVVTENIESAALVINFLFSMTKKKNKLFCSI